ncbi:GNAT family N-acetyltransferase [Candidatus Woesearchaeota archaeon]|nr:GNAT family N-acetyltransferase [Candidatus Woesearchaeota archaeon]
MEFSQKNLDILEDILEIEKLSFPKQYGEDIYRERLKDKSYWIHAAEDNGRIAGYSIMYQDDGRGYIWITAVHPDYRRQGIAGRLIEMQCQLSREQGYKSVYLKTWRPEMIALCSKNGFKKTKEEKDHWGKGLDAVFMEKEL